MNLRPMMMSDADFMLELKNDPATREFAIVSHDEIKKEDHYKWLEKNIWSFQVIDGDYERIGAVRIFANEISIWIDKKFRGLGVAGEVLHRVSKEGYFAKVVDGNVASLRTFTRAGYRPVAHSATEKYYLLQR